LNEFALRPSQAPTQPILEPSDVVVIALASGESPARATAQVVVVDGARVGLSVSQPLFGLGDSVTLDVFIPNDARYRIAAQAESIEGGLLFLRLGRSWERIQRREYFRVAANGIPVRVERSKSSAGQSKLAHCTLIDLSAGGVQLQGSADFKVGEAVRFILSLPGLSPMPLTGRVVRVSPLSSEGPSSAGLCFVAVTPERRAELLRWAYSLQAQRRSLELEAVVSDRLGSDRP
jgi:Tfp pilus assembly protein PilZ